MGVLPALAAKIPHRIRIRSSPAQQPSSSSNSSRPRQSTRLGLCQQAQQYQRHLPILVLGQEPQKADCFRQDAANNPSVRQSQSAVLAVLSDIRCAF